MELALGHSYRCSVTDDDDALSRIELPDAPSDQAAILAAGGVACWSEPVSIDTYEPASPDRYPLFLDRRVYQGSSGKVYPMPFIESVSREKAPRLWQAIHIETEWIRLMLLPEIGGRIHIGYDKSADYDFFYRNNVIKPALVGLAGPWISGGVEFNWPQHHRPTTFLPVETSIDREDDGAVTVWHSSIDSLQGIQGTYGVRLRPGSALIEVEARILNPRDEPQTFLWWANVAARSHEEYQSFFPTDVRFVADHARRAITAFPRADRPYYGVDYPALASNGDPDADRIDLYGNIPVPTSYMITDTRDDFFGGYDHRAKAGFVHWADHTISPGKKQWTWGNGPVGHAWDAHLTDSDGPYVELMAGVFTDNQPDFSFIAPAETKRFSQFWYPISQMGPAHQATKDAAVSLTRTGSTVTIGVSSSAAHPVATIELFADDALVGEWSVELSPGAPFLETLAVEEASTLRVRVAADGRELVSWIPRARDENPEEPWAAEEPPTPSEIPSSDELYQTGVHLAQYRHPTRSPIPYFDEVLERDPSDTRASIALGSWHFRRGEYESARGHFDTALERLTRRNLNPQSGEASYRLGLVLERLGELDEARERFAKASWDFAWARPATHAVARLDLRAGHPAQALERLRDRARIDAPDSQTAFLVVLALRALGDTENAAQELAAARALDPLDPLLLALDGSLDVVDPRTPVDVALSLVRAGAVDDALALTAEASGNASIGFTNPGPMRHYLRALWLEAAGASDAAADERRIAREADSRFTFPFGLDDYDALVRALAVDPGDVVAAALLGAWYLDAGRIDDARAVLLTSTSGGSVDPVAWRNAGISLVKTDGDLDEADALFGRALALSPNDARLVFERDLLAVLRRVPSSQRLSAIEQHDRSVLKRDDLMLSYLHLLVDEDRVDDALEILETRWFQPFEGGEGQVIAAWDRATLASARILIENDPHAARAFLERTADVPVNLGEGRHPATSLAERHVLLGDVLILCGEHALAAESWERGRNGTAPLAVAPRLIDASDYWVGIAHTRLGEIDEALAVWTALENRAAEIEAGPLAVDYFATSLPELLLFDTDTEAARTASAAALRWLAETGRAATSQGARA